ncbi:hypothetical protein [Nostoc sp.]
MQVKPIFKGDRHPHQVAIARVMRSTMKPHIQNYDRRHQQILRPALR